MKGKVLAAATALAAGVIAGVLLYNKYYDHRVSNFSAGAEFYVYPGMSPEAVRDSILASGSVKNSGSLRRSFKTIQSVRPGHYTIGPKSTSIYAARMVNAGWQTPVMLTLSGSIRSAGTLAKRISLGMLTDSTSMAQFLTSRDSLKAYGITPELLFTKVIPDSYQILWTASPREIFTRLSQESDAWWNEERLAAAAAQGLTRNEACTLASIVNGETRYEPEQPTIAGVYLNRLRIGMKLQADPTVAFCFDYKPSRILKSHLQVDSPYNTYKWAGLPPGPISCPPKSCLEAVIHPLRHNYIFFCADPSLDGTHRFASTYAQHKVNARAFQKAITERAKAQKNQ